MIKTISIPMFDRLNYYTSPIIVIYRIEETFDWTTVVAYTRESHLHPLCVTRFAAFTTRLLFFHSRNVANHESRSIYTLQGRWGVHKIVTPVLPHAWSRFLFISRKIEKDLPSTRCNVTRSEMALRLIANLETSTPLNHGGARYRADLPIQRSLTIVNPFWNTGGDFSWRAVDSENHRQKKKKERKNVLDINYRQLNCLAFLDTFCLTRASSFDKTMDWDVGF